MKIETLAVHGGYTPDPTTKAVAVPIYQTTSYAFDDTQHGADLFDLKVKGNIYTRIMNPTTDVLEQRLAAMEGGIGGLALASGMAATTYAVMTITEAGDNIVTSSALYGGTYNLFAHTLPQYGIEVRFADYRKPASFEKLIDDRTKLVFCESIGNPLGNVVDFGALADVAHAAGIPLIVDNTVPTPYLCRPFEHGADIVVHALTKYLGGHGNSIGGAIVDSGRFPWADHKKKYKRLNEPDVSYHGVVYTEALGPAAFIARARVVPLRNMGAPISPFNSFLILQGIETLAVRMDRICDNTLAVAQYLQKHSKVIWVRYAGLPDHADRPLVDKYMSGKASGILSFGIRGGREAGARFIDALKLVTRLVNIGDAKSLACHPATTTHRQLGPHELELAGVSEDMVRLSIGIEHIDDIIADVDQALAAA
ncbi:MAG: aminotransferase class V-fold PLP-dependent enzyme [Betaproteobacteria bacterium]|nr:aminotransferase class V-fold PLP-dependent enzyme [Betaproteobacteria bacterium]